MRKILIAVLLPVALAACTSSNELPAVSYDGLELRKHSTLRVVYVRPGASLEPYQRIKLLDCFVAFKKDWQKNYNREARGAGRKVTESEMERIRQTLADEFRRVFTDELQAKGGYQLVDETGADVLLLRPAIINLDPAGPDVMEPGMTRTIVNSAGQMTLYLELYDSATGDIIARVVDPRAARGYGGQMKVANRVTNKQEADRILRRWASVLRGHLDAAHENDG